jgi:hypothetical protein
MSVLQPSGQRNASEPGDPVIHFNGEMKSLAAMGDEAQ